jgi:hypothetical protein
VDKKLLYMGIAGLILLILMLICGGICAVYIIRAIRPHTNEIDDRPSSVSPFRFVNPQAGFLAIPSPRR